MFESTWSSMFESTITVYHSMFESTINYNSVKSQDLNIALERFDLFFGTFFFFRLLAGKMTPWNAPAVVSLWPVQSVQFVQPVQAAQAQAVDSKHLVGLLGKVNPWLSMSIHVVKLLLLRKPMRKPHALPYGYLTLLYFIAIVQCIDSAFEC